MRIKTSKLNLRDKKINQMAVVATLLIIVVITAGLIIGYLYLSHHQEEKSKNERSQSLDLITDPVSDSEKKSYTVPDIRPRYLTIPSIGINQARIQEIGLLSPNGDGGQQMDAPQNIHDAGWYNCQNNPIVANRCAKPVLPGDGDIEYAAVIDGHSCSPDGCMFDNLGKMKDGDDIAVQLGSGTIIHYEVKHVEIIKLADVDMAKVMRPIEQGRPGLNIITCEGRWTSRDSRGVATMDNRAIVYASQK